METLQVAQKKHSLCQAWVSKATNRVLPSPPFPVIGLLQAVQRFEKSSNEAADVGARFARAAKCIDPGWTEPTVHLGHRTIAEGFSFPKALGKNCSGSGSPQHRKTFELKSKIRRYKIKNDFLKIQQFLRTL